MWLVLELPQLLTTPFLATTMYTTGDWLLTVTIDNFWHLDAERAIVEAAITTGFTIEITRAGVLGSAGGGLLLEGSGIGEGALR